MILASFYRWENWKLGKLCSLSKIILLVTGSPKPVYFSTGLYWPTGKGRSLPHVFIFINLGIYGHSGAIFWILKVYSNMNCLLSPWIIAKPKSSTKHSSLKFSPVYHFLHFQILRAFSHSLSFLLFSLLIYGCFSFWKFTPKASEVKMPQAGGERVVLSMGGPRAGSTSLPGWGVLETEWVKSWYWVGEVLVLSGWGLGTEWGTSYGIGAPSARKSSMQGIVQGNLAIVCNNLYGEKRMEIYILYIYVYI